MRSKNPSEWFKDSYCKVCKERTCTRSSSGVYVVQKNENLIPCLLSLLLMVQVERESIKVYRKEKPEEKK